MINPGTSNEVSFRRIVLIIRVNSPMVRRIRGKLKSVNMGLINILMSPKITAARMVALALVKYRPDNR